MCTCILQIIRRELPCVVLVVHLTTHCFSQNFPSLMSNGLNLLSVNHASFAEIEFLPLVIKGHSNMKIIYD